MQFRFCPINDGFPLDFQPESTSLMLVSSNGHQAAKHNLDSGYVARHATNGSLTDRAENL